MPGQFVQMNTRRAMLALQIAIEDKHFQFGENYFGIL